MPNIHVWQEGTKGALACKDAHWVHLHKMLFCTNLLLVSPTLGGHPQDCLRAMGLRFSPALGVGHIFVYPSLTLKPWPDSSSCATYCLPVAIGS